MVCPKDFKPCIDDLCYGGGCIRMPGYPMIRRCEYCGQLVDDEGDLECDCENDEPLDNEPSWVADLP
jgi:hypothetical protein